MQGAAILHCSSVRLKVLIANNNKKCLVNHSVNSVV